MANNSMHRIRSLPGNTLSQSRPDRQYTPPHGMPPQGQQPAPQQPQQTPPWWQRHMQPGQAPVDPNWWQQHTQGNTLAMPGSMPAPLRDWLQQLRTWQEGGQQGQMPRPQFMQGQFPGQGGQGVPGQAPGGAPWWRR